MSDDKVKEVRKETKKEKKERKKERKLKKEEKADKEVNEDTNDSEEDDEEVSKEEQEQIEIDLNAGVPLSKKQQRLLKKGKLNLQRLAAKNPAPKPILTKEEEEAEAKKLKKSPFGVWVGNLSFDTSKEDIVRFIMGKTNDFISINESNEDDDKVKVENIDITRINLPKKGTKIKGFAYLDLPSQKHVNTVVSLSESILNGRKLLIKNSNSFEGRPEKDQNDTASLSKNPPSRILFVGNLSFDTTQDLLEEHFRHCGDIVKIRMATFEDSGKCKGFAFIDFKDESGPTTALKSKLAKKLINRPLRLEYGEDRSKRVPGQRKRQAEEGFEDQIEDSAPRTIAKERSSEPDHQYSQPPKKRVFREPNPQNNKRMKSSVALATAQRASAAIVPSSGKKTTFD